MFLNLNADLGESFGAWQMGNDAQLLPLIDSASVACGFHAGDPLVMRHTVRAALQAGVSLGAHPSFPDLQGFGRRPMQMAVDEVEAMVLYQISALAGVIRAEGGRLTHVKPHGALSNMACEDAVLAQAIVRAVLAFDDALLLLAPVCSELAAAARSAGLRVGLEVFADRAYTDRGTLVSRRLPGAVLHEPEACIAHVRRMVAAGGVISQSGQVLTTPFHSVCVHGDHPEALSTARCLRAALQADGHALLPLPALLDAWV